MLQLLLFGCIVFPLIAAVAVALDKEGTLRRRIVYAGTGITALSALGLALYGSFVLPISPDSSLQPLMTVLDLALLVFILYVAVNIRHRLSMGLALGQLAGMIYLDFFMLEGHQATAFLADPLALVMVLVISLVGGIVCIFGLGYMQEHEDHLRLAKSKQSRFFFFLLLFLGAMNGLVLCDSLTWVFFFWEITTLCSFFLISHDGTREAKRNATRALWMNMVGGIGFLAAMLFMQKAIGTLSIGETGEEVFIGREWVQNKNYSEETARLVDAEVKRIVEEAHARCVKLLQDNRAALDRIAQALLERETISGEELDLLMENKPLLPLDANGKPVKAAPAGDFVLEPDPADTDAAAPEADKAAEPAPEKAEQGDGDTGNRTQDNDENEQRKQ